MTASPGEVGLFFSNLYGALVSSGSAGAGYDPKNATGSWVALAQAGSSIASLVAGSVPAAAQYVNGVGFVTSGAGLYANYQSWQTTHDITAADAASIAGNAAGLVGSGLVFFGGGEMLIIPLAVVSASASALSTALVLSHTAYKVDPDGTITKTDLAPSQWADAASQLQSAAANPEVIASAMSSAGITVGENTFLVPQFDSDGNITGFAPETPLTTNVLGNGHTLYGFSNGTSLDQEPSSSVVDGETNINVNPASLWSNNNTNGSSTNLTVSPNGSFTSSSTAQDGTVTQDNFITSNTGVTTVQGSETDPSGALVESKGTAITVNATGTKTSTSVNENAVGVSDITVVTSGQIATTTNLYSPDGKLISLTTVSQNGSSITSFNDPNDPNVSTTNNYDRSGNLTSVSTTVKNSDGSYSTSLADPSGNLITPTVTGSAPSRPFDVVGGIQDSLDLYNAIKAGNTVAAVGDALRLATVLSKSNPLVGIASTVVGDAENVLGLAQAIHDKNVGLAVEDGTAAAAALASALGYQNQFTGAALQLVQVGVDLSNGNYKQALQDVVYDLSPELGVAIEILNLLRSLFPNTQYFVPATAGAETISFGNAPADSADFEYLDDGTRNITISLGSGEGTVNAGKGALTLEAGTNLGHDTIAIANSDGQNISTDKTLVVGDGIDSSAVLLERAGDDMIFHIGNMGQSVTVKNWFGAGAVQLGNVQFDDGTVWHLGSDQSQSLYQFGDATTQTLTAVAGYKNIVFAGDIAETIVAQDNSNVTVVGGAGPSIIQVGESVNATIATLSGSDTINLNGVSGHGAIDLGSGNSVVTATNSDNPAAWLDGTIYDINLGTGDNTIVQNWAAFDYTYNLGGGNDIIESPEGYTLKPTSVKTIEFGAGITEANLSFVRSGENLVVNAGVNSGSITLQNFFKFTDARIGSFQFSDGLSFTSDDLKKALIPYHGDGDLEGWDGDDEIYAGTGNDTLTTNGGNDILHGGNGNDTFSVTQGSNAAIDTGSGDNAINVVLASADIALGSGQNRLVLDSGDFGVTVKAGAGQTDITLGALYTAPTTELFAGSGVMTLTGDGYYTNLHYDRGDGVVTVDSFASASGDALAISTLFLGAGIGKEDLFLKRSDDDLLLLLDGQTEAIKFTGWFDGSYRQFNAMQFADGTTVSTTSFDEAIQASNGALTRWDELIGTSGNDTLQGTTGAQEFDGNGGQDVLIGDGGDTFLFEQGYGKLEIEEWGFYNKSTPNLLRLGAGISQGSIEVAVEGDNLIVSDGFAGDEIQLDGMGSLNWDPGTSSGIQTINFADGSSLTAAQIIKQAHEINGTTNSDHLSGTGGSDIFDGLGGGDILTGNGGNDTFIFNPGYGGLEINEFNYSAHPDNILKLGAGIEAENLRVSVSNSDLVMTDGISGDSIRLDGMGSTSWALSSPDGIQQIEFSDGSVLSATQLVSMSHVLTGTSASDSITGTSTGDLIDGKGGNDSIDGDGGSDTFVYNQGYGQLNLREFNVDAGARSVLQLGAAITRDAISVSLSSDRSSLILTDSFAGDEITLHAMLAQYSGVNEVLFADGTSLSAAQLIEMETTGTGGADTLAGTIQAEVFDGRGGNDYEIGAGGNDTFVFNPGYGRLEVYEYDFGANPDNVLKLGAGVTADDLNVSVSGADLLVTDGTSGDSIRLDGMGSASWVPSSSEGIQQVQFSDGSVLSAQQLVNFSHAIFGTSASDSLTGTSSGDLIDGKGGNDSVDGGSGDDTFVFNRGYGQLNLREFNDDASAHSVLQLGAGIAHDALSVTLSSDQSSLILKDGYSGDEITVHAMLDDYFGVDEVRFADGTSLSAAQLVQMETTGTNGADTLVGTSQAEVIDGRGGNDYEVGAGGNDTFVFNAGYGSLEVSEYDYAAAPQNLLLLGAGINEASLSAGFDGEGNLVITDGIAGDSILLDEMGAEYWSANSPEGIQTILFADGTTWSAQKLETLAHTFTGTSANDSLNGTSQADFFDGKGGSDVEVGMGGNDTFYYAEGYGALEITETDSNSKRANILELGTGITVGNIKVGHDGAGTSLIISDGVAGDKITLDTMLSSTSGGIQSLLFADGTTLTRTQLVAIETTGTNGADSLYGTSSADLFDGHGSNDFEVGRGGNDTFIFNKGYGHLEVSESDSSSKRNNVIQLGAGITASSVLVTHNSAGTGIVMTDGTTGDQVTIDTMISSVTGGVQTVQFADGTTWSRAQILQLETTGTTAADTLYGTSGADLFDGKGGSDTERGAGGADTYSLASGYGALTVINGVSNTNSAAGTLAIAVENPNNVWMRQVGSNLEVDVMGTKTEATIQGWFSNNYSKLSNVTVSGGSAGMMMVDAQLTQLIQAMATYSSSHTGFDPTASANPTITDSTVLAAVSNAWHTPS